MKSTSATINKDRDNKDYINSNNSNAVELRMDLTYHHAAGKHFSFFFEKLKQKEIYATRCPSCKNSYLPPRPFCGRCNVHTKDWVRVGPRGIVRATSRVYLPILDPKSGKNRDVPHNMVLVQFENASTMLHHIIVDSNVDIVEMEQAVEVVFADNMEGKMTDILGFRLINNYSENKNPMVLDADQNPQKYLTVTERLQIPFRYSTGDIGADFFARLKDQKLCGLECQDCGRQNLPPTRFCYYCLSEKQNWFEASLTGSVIGVAHLEKDKRSHLPDDVFGFALVTLDGMQTSFFHHIADEKLQKKDRARLTFREQRNGNILDVKGFIRDNNNE